jgi:hypothetical protein
MLGTGFFMYILEMMSKDMKTMVAENSCYRKKQSERGMGNTY